MSSATCLSVCSRPFVMMPPPSPSTELSSSSVNRVSSVGCKCSVVSVPAFASRLRFNSQIQMKARKMVGVVCMAPEEEKLTRRNPLDFPIEWERPRPGRRPDIFPQFSPMKTPLPPPLPCDPPEEDEEEEEKKEKEEEEENPEKEEQENPQQQ